MNVPAYIAPARTVGDAGFTADVNAARAQVAAMTDFLDNYTGGATPTVGTVIVLSGQSNMEGAGDISDLNTKGFLSSRNLTRTFQRVFIWNLTTNAWEQLKVGGLNVGNQMGYTYDSRLAPYGNFFGPEIAIADRWERTNAGVLYLIKYAFGGTYIAEWQAGETKRLRLDQSVHNGLTALTAQGISYTFAALAWNQGENNVGDSTAAYLAAETQLFNSFAGDWLPNDALRVLTLLTPSRDTNGTIRPAQLQYLAANPQTRFVDATNYPYRTDVPVHYDAIGQYLQGADILAAMQKADNSAPGATTIVSSNSSRPLPSATADLVFNPLGATITLANRVYTTSSRDNNIYSGGLSALKSTVGTPFGLYSALASTSGTLTIAGFSLANAFSSVSAYYLDYAVFLDRQADGTSNVTAITGNAISPVIKVGAAGSRYGVFGDSDSGTFDVYIGEVSAGNVITRLKTLVADLNQPVYPQFRISGDPGGYSGLTNCQYYGLS